MGLHVARVVRVVDGVEVDYVRTITEASVTEGTGARDSSSAGLAGMHQHEPAWRSPPGDHLGMGRAAQASSASLAEPRGLHELRRKLAWAVGSVYGVRYVGFNTWPADYARKAAERLISIHGEP